MSDSSKSNKVHPKQFQSRTKIKSPLTMMTWLATKKVEKASTKPQKHVINSQNKHSSNIGTKPLNAGKRTEISEQDYEADTDENDSDSTKATVKSTRSTKKSSITKVEESEYNTEPISNCSVTSGRNSPLQQRVSIPRESKSLARDKITSLSPLFNPFDDPSQS